MEDLVAWLRRRIEERRHLAQHTIELGSAAEWTELSSGVLMTCPPDAPQDCWDGVWAMGDSSLTRLMEANDPRDTIARCEAELAILDEHTAVEAGPGVRFCSRCLVWHDNPARLRGTHPDLGLVGVAAPAPYPCRTVQMLAHGYRNRPGWRDEWGPVTRW